MRSSGHSLSPRLEVAAEFLLPLDRLEERLEVSLAKPERTVALDELEEDRGTILNRPGEDLQQVAVFVAIHEDSAAFQLVDGRTNVTDASAKFGVVVIAVRRAQELNAEARMVSTLARMSLVFRARC